MFKFIHAADIHLDSPMHKLDLYEGAPAEAFRQATRKAFENLIQTALVEDASFIVIAGDLYDGDWKDYNTGLYLKSQMAKLRDAGIAVFIVSGNHDAASRITKTLKLPDNTRVFSPDKPSTCILKSLGVAIHGQSFASPFVKKNLACTYPDAVSGLYNIGLLHTCATGRQGHEPYAPCSLEDLKNKGYDYWALGHVHKHELIGRHPPIVFSGNIQGRHVRETGPKGAVLVKVDDTHEANLEFISLDVVRWDIVHVDATGAESGYDIMDRVQESFQSYLEKNDGMPLALRVYIRGETTAGNDILSDLEHWMNEIRSIAIDTGNGKIWVENIRVDTRLPGDSRHVLERKDGAIGELLTLFDELNIHNGLHQELIGELADLERKIPRELKDETDGLRFEDTDWIKNMLKQVRPMLFKRLLKKSALE
ncbi:MAG: DNA repair exonuclease [Desulfobacterales bacterium]